MFRHYNPTVNWNPTITDFSVQNLNKVSFFDSVAKARAFLLQVSCLSKQQLNEPSLQAKISAAEKIIARADKRNARRRRRRQEKRGLSASGAECLDAIAEARQACGPNVVCYSETNNKKVLTPPTPQYFGPNWEEVLGPKGEVIKFKIEYYKTGPDQGTIKNRTRSKASPKPGDIILDLTSGLKAWKVTTSGKRTPITPTRTMEDEYKNSYLYKVRQLAAGQISTAQFADFLKQPVAAKKRNLKRHKKKK